MTDAPDDLDHPLHTVKVARQPVRIFGIEHGLLWISFTDICRAANLSRVQRDRFWTVAIAARDDAPEGDLWVQPKRVVTADGSEMVLSQVAACGAIGAMIRGRIIPQSFAGEFRDACEDAMTAIFDGTPPEGAIERVRVVALVMFEGARPS